MKAISPKYLIIFLLNILLVCSISAQSAQEMKALNTYVEFLNESVHGLTIAHILLENHNKDINRYVDLNDTKENSFLTNQILSENIFDDPDYTTRDSGKSPIILSRELLEGSNSLGNNTTRVLNGYVKEIVTVLNSINDLRYEIETYVEKHDLEDRKNIYPIYGYLEKGVLLFNKYESLHDKLSKRLKDELKYSSDLLFLIFDEIHTASVLMLQELREDDDRGIDTYLDRIDGSTKNFAAQNRDLITKNKRVGDEILTKLRRMITFVRDANSTGNIPVIHELYGKEYYIHNQILKTHFNSISPGYASKMNLLMTLEGKNFLSFDDRPLIFKIIYPKKIEEIKEIANNPTVASVPRKTVKPQMDFSSSVSAPEVIESDYIELEFFDPNMYDRDSISVSFNDEWILTDYMLKGERKKIKLEIDRSKTNSLMVLAKNEGLISPNTVACKYRYNGKGKKEDILLKLNANEAYERILTVEGMSDF